MRKAFTMIELIFVIVILGILASVAIPKINAAREDAELAKSMTFFKTLLTDIAGYFVGTGKISNDLKDMTHIRLEEAKDGIFYFKIRNEVCLKIESNANANAVIFSKTDSQNKPVCKMLYEYKGFHEQMRTDYQCPGESEILTETDNVAGCGEIGAPGTGETKEFDINKDGKVYFFYKPKTVNRY